ncbi:MAG: STAS domain-containing protein [Actinobacteria bacterium]|nr:STAS domain-containing protein [Actinomycetota bacterium]
MELEVTTMDIGDYTVIKLKGEVDIYTAPSLRETIVDTVEKGRYKIVVDLDEVNFLDSTGLGVLVGGLKRVKQHEGELGIICNQEKVLRIFKITGLTKIFKMFESADEL